MATIESHTRFLNTWNSVPQNAVSSKDATSSPEENGRLTHGSGNANTASSNELGIHSLHSHCIINVTDNYDEEKASEKSKKPSGWERFQELCNSTTMHGLGHLFPASSPKFFRSRRLVWCCALLTCVFLSLYSISEATSVYLSHPVNTVLKLNYVDELDFPVVTICNNNFVRKSWANSTPFLAVVKAYSALPGKDDAPINWTAYNWTGFKIDQIMQDAGHQMKDMLFECEWKGISCGPQNFTNDTTSLGVCHTFNYNQTLKVTGAGPFNALHLVLNIQQHEYIGNIMSGAGIRLVLREKHEPPSDRFAIALQPGTQTLIPLVTRKVKSLPAPYGNCQLENHLEMFDEYSVSACIFECRAKLASKKCSCREMYPSRIKTNIPICLPEHYRDCLIPLVASINTQGLCPHSKNPCVSTTYTGRMSFSQYPANHIADHMASERGTTRQTIRDNFLEINIHFEEMYFESVEQLPAYTFPTFTGVIGGHLGAFIGASLLTVLEFLEFLFSFLPRKAKVQTSQK